jgi:hypothetical protein
MRGGTFNLLFSSSRLVSVGISWGRSGASRAQLKVEGEWSINFFVEIVGWMCLGITLAPSPEIPLAFRRYPSRLPMSCASGSGAQKNRSRYLPNGTQAPFSRFSEDTISFLVFGRLANVLWSEASWVWTTVGGFKDKRLSSYKVYRKSALCWRTSLGVSSRPWSHTAAMQDKASWSCHGVGQLQKS